MSLVSPQTFCKRKAALDHWNSIPHSNEEQIKDQKHGDLCIESVVTDLYLVDINSG